LAFNQNDLLAILSDDSVISIVNVTTRSLVQDLRGHSCGITCIAFSPNNLLASGSVNGTIHVWETESWSLVKQLVVEFEAGRVCYPNGYVNSVAFGPNEFLAAGLANATVRVWNTETWESSYRLKREEGEEGDTNVGLNGNRLISAIGNRVFIWKERTGSFN
jgi:WD40 repeat protein